MHENKETYHEEEKAALPAQPEEIQNDHPDADVKKAKENTKLIKLTFGVLFGVMAIMVIATCVFLFLPHDAASKDAGNTAGSVTEVASESASSSSDTEAAAPTHTHDWAITYKTVHHDAVTHLEHVSPVFQEQTSYHTVCNECKQVIDGKADAHIKETGHSGYSTNVPITDEVMTSQGYEKEIIDTPAYDETVIDKLVCTTCGETKDAPSSDAAN